MLDADGYPNAYFEDNNFRYEFFSAKIEDNYLSSKVRIVKKKSHKMKINNRRVGREFEPFIVAEVSANHNGDIECAKNTISEAKRCGADAVKLQTYTPDTMTINSKNEDFVSRMVFGKAGIYMNFIKRHTLLLNGIKNYMTLLMIKT